MEKLQEQLVLKISRDIYQVGYNRYLTDFKIHKFDIYIVQKYNFWFQKLLTLAESIEQNFTE